MNEAATVRVTGGGVLFFAALTTDQLIINGFIILF